MCDTRCDTIAGTLMADYLVRTCRADISRGCMVFGFVTMFSTRIADGWGSVVQPVSAHAFRVIDLLTVVTCTRIPRVVTTSRWLCGGGVCKGIPPCIA